MTRQRKSHTSTSYAVFIGAVIGSSILPLRLLDFRRCGVAYSNLLTRVECGRFGV